MHAAGAGASLMSNEAVSERRSMTAHMTGTRDSEQYGADQEESKPDTHRGVRGGSVMDGEISSQRAARNQSLYREINETISELNRTYAEAGFETNEWICECADTECTTRLQATLDEYETVRSNPRTFIVSPGHLFPEVERALSENDRFTIVEKVDNAGQVAEALDPRQRTS
jgi:hypothetical protein